MEESEGTIAEGGMGLFFEICSGDWDSREARKFGLKIIPQNAETTITLRGWRSRFPIGAPVPEGANRKNGGYQIGPRTQRPIGESERGPIS
jgi:hypothetical protein